MRYYFGEKTPRAEHGTRGTTWLCTELFCEWNDPPYGRSGFQCSSINPKPFAIVYYAENKKRLVPMDSIEKVER